MMKVNIYVRVQHNTMSKKGKAIVLLEYMGHKRFIHFSTFDSTQNQSIIIAATEGVRRLKKPCEIHLYVQSNFGFKFMDNDKRWVNRDYGYMLDEALVIGDHTIIYYDCSNIDIVADGKMKQNILRQMIDSI